MCARDDCLEPLSVSTGLPSTQDSSVAWEHLQLCNQKLSLVDARMVALERELEELKAQRSVIEEERSRCANAQPSAPGFKVAASDSEHGWDDDTPSDAKVIDYLNGQEVKRRIAWTVKMIDPQPVANGLWSFHSIFADGDFMAAGHLVIPPNGRKSTKATKDNSYIFHVIEGAVKMKVHNSSLVLAPGGMFMVPRGNTYSIENISQRDAKLFFTQARKTMNDTGECLTGLGLLNKHKKFQRASSGIRRSGSVRRHGRSPLVPDSVRDQRPFTVFEKDMDGFWILGSRARQFGTPTKTLMVRAPPGTPFPYSGGC
ncbi:hypothetical protein EST38_g5573 [Candolleomyces aberdarensis]|uniref:CENP-C homolog n=1 Tax=Candolleomyces aberdarensis TaxID=2316362 RepID=A0A4Q2DK43_9AGAR|nr:hypothetical protein EST38_g5573 [Candolleomyces aberdarensis]